MPAQPALRSKLRRIVAPVRGQHVDGPGTEDDVRALWDRSAADGGVDARDARGDGHGWVEAQDFGREGREVGEGGYVGCGLCVGGGGFGVDRGGSEELVAETGLGLGMFAHEVDGPGEGCGGGVVAGDEEGAHLFGDEGRGHAGFEGRGCEVRVDDFGVGGFLVSKDEELFGVGSGEGFGLAGEAVAASAVEC